MKTETKIIIVVSLIIVIFLAFGICYIIYLNTAHSTFDNYYNFRGCIELINKTNDYGFCRIDSGKIIKIVQYNDRWYLDGDLPVKCFWIFDCP